MKLRVKRFDKNLPLPEYKTDGAAAFDLTSRESFIIKPKEIAYIPLNVAIELPEGYVSFLAARSSLHKKGLILINGIGVIDSDFCGEKDEYTAACLNFTDKTVLIEKGDRLCQAVIARYEKAEWEETDYMNKNNRGGFGSTG